MEISISEIPNNLPAAKKQHKRLLENEKRLDELFELLNRYLEEGKRGDVTDEYLVDQWKRTDKTTKSMLAEKKALEDKIKELENDTTLLSEANRENVCFENKPLTSISEQPLAQKISAKSSSHTVAIPLLEKQKLQTFRPTTTQILKGIQTMSGGNEEKYSLQDIVSSMTGAPQVSFNYSLSSASTLDHFCASTTTGKEIMLTPTASQIRGLNVPDVLLLLGPGSRVLLVMAQFSTVGLKSLSVSVYVLLLSTSQSTFQTSSPISFVPKDVLNSESPSGSELLAMSQLSIINGPAERLKPPSTHKLLPRTKTISPATYRVRKKTWPSLLTVTIQLLPTGKIPPQLGQVQCYQSSCGAVEEGLTIPISPSIVLYNAKSDMDNAASYQRYRFGNILTWLNFEHYLFRKQLDNSGVDSKLCSSQDTISLGNHSHSLPDSSKRRKVEILKKPRAAFKLGSLTQGSAKARALNLNAEDDRFYELVNDYLLENELQEKHNAVEVSVASTEKNIIHLLDDSQRDENHFTEIDLSDDDETTKRSDSEDIFKAACGGSECHIKRKKKKRRSICRIIFSLFSSCIGMQ